MGCRVLEELEPLSLGKQKGKGSAWHSTSTHCSRKEDARVSAEELTGREADSKLSSVLVLMSMRV